MTLNGNNCLYYLHFRDMSLLSLLTLLKFRDRCKSYVTTEFSTYAYVRSSVTHLAAFFR